HGASPWVVGPGVAAPGSHFLNTQHFTVVQRGLRGFFRFQWARTALSTLLLASISLWRRLSRSRSRRVFTSASFWRCSAARSQNSLRLMAISSSFLLWFTIGPSPSDS